MKRATRHYCTECDWSASIEDHTPDELFQASIEHFSETKHTIESDVPSLFTDIGRHPILHFRLFNYKERILQ